PLADRHPRRGRRLAGLARPCMRWLRSLRPEYYRGLEDEAAALRDEETVRELGGVRRPRSEMMLLLTPDGDLGGRGGHRPFLDFVQAVDGAVKGYFRDVPLPGAHDLQVACALLPGGRLLLEVQARPEDVPGETLTGLRRRVEAVARPEVRHGPVAF